MHETSTSDLAFDKEQLIKGQRILSPSSRTTPSLTKHNKPIFSGMVSRQSQLHSGRFKMRSRHLHVIAPTES